MYRSRCILAVSLPLLVIAGFWAATRVAESTAAQETTAAQESTPQQRDAGCNCATPRKVALPRDPQEREALLERLTGERLARRAEQLEKTRRLGLQWDGCKFYTAAKEGEDGFGDQREIADYLIAMQPEPPKQRDAHCDWLLPRYVIVGWSGTVMSVAQSKEGKRIELRVRPTLATQGGHRGVFTPYCLQEIWARDADNKLTCESCAPYSGQIRISEACVPYPGDTKIVFVD